MSQILCMSACENDNLPLSHRLERMLQPEPTKTRKHFSQSEYQIKNNSNGWPSPEAKIIENLMGNLYELEFHNHDCSARHNTQIQERQQLDNLYNVARTSQVPTFNMINHLPYLQPVLQRQREQLGTWRSTIKIDNRFDRGDGTSNNDWEAEEMSHNTPPQGINSLNAVDLSIFAFLEEEFMRNFIGRHENRDAEVLKNDLIDSINFLKSPHHGIQLKRNIKPNLYKTEICRIYKKFGCCLYGSKCLFAHSDHELRAKPKQHIKYKTVWCKNYRAGHCPYGSRCCFIHDQGEQQYSF